MPVKGCRSHWGPASSAHQSIAITHGHSDHVLGLPGFAGARRFGKGASDKPWTVVYPAQASGVEVIKDTIRDLWKGVTFPISWVPLAPGNTHPIGRDRVLEAFEVTHVPPDPAFGYRVLETRRRLKPDYAHLSPHDIELRAREHGRDALMEEFHHVLFAHSGDAMPIPPALVREADLLVHDATFLGQDERRALIHATSDEALQVARDAGVHALVLNHLSIRYDRVTAIPRLRDQVIASGFAGECWLLDEGEFISLR